MTDKELITALRKACQDCNPTPCCEYEVLGREAADRIERLQSELTAYKSTDLTPSEIKSLLSYGGCGESIIGHCNMSGIVADLKSENTRLKAERDKAVEDLKEITKYNGSLTCNCNEILDIANKWRGLEETK